MEQPDIEAVMARLASIESLLQHVLAELQSQRLRELKVVGPPDPRYPKIVPSTGAQPWGSWQRWTS